MPIDGYEFGRIVVDGRTYTSDVIVWPEGVDDSWWRENGHRLSRKDVRPLLGKMPAVLIIGTGAAGRLKVPPDLLLYLAENCGEIHVERTAEACEKYNHATAMGKRAVAGMHLTC